jgi:hypothetical protein
VHGTVLIGGRALATWHIKRAGDGPAELVVDHIERLRGEARAEVRAEGQRFVRFHEPDPRGARVRLVGR